METVSDVDLGELGLVRRDEVMTEPALAAIGSVVREACGPSREQGRAHGGDLD
jgi:hypothetical protein